MYKYIGKGAWIYGVPARDLSDEEVKQFGERYVLDSGLFIKEKTKHEELETRGKKTWRE